MLIDSHKRKIDYLRISVTDRCNLRCTYCMPAEGIDHRPQEDILSFEEIHKAVSIAAGLGIEKIRITGGEPLVRKDLHLLVEKLRGIRGLREIALTTNGTLLRAQSSSLKKAGLDRVNISLDSLVAEKFRQVTRGGDIETVLEGIESALSSGFSSVKVNTVMIKDFNTDEIPAFASLAQTKPLHVRFIEYMPTDTGYFASDNLFFSALEARDICGRLGRLDPVDSDPCAPARVFRIGGFRGTIGFISPITEPFCSFCNKLRLTSDGRLRSCLHSSHDTDLKKAIRAGASQDHIAALFKEAAAAKPESHDLSQQPLRHDHENFSMCQIGG